MLNHLLIQSAKAQMMLNQVQNLKKFRGTCELKQKVEASKHGERL